jgi:hypothetical protein
MRTELSVSSFVLSFSLENRILAKESHVGIGVPAGLGMRAGNKRLGPLPQLFIQRLPFI